MKKVLITGGEGFIGSYLCRCLEEKGHEITIVGRNLTPDEKKIKLDLSNLDSQDELTRGYDVVIHLASMLVIDEAANRPKETITNNVNATLNLLENVRINNPQCLFILASSDKIYGNPSSEVVSERDQGIPIEPYGYSKLNSELLVQLYHHLYRINYLIIRSGNVFGLNLNLKLFIPAVMSQIAQGKDVIEVGNLDSFRNFIYVEDLVVAYAAGVENLQAKNNTFNINAYHKQISEVTQEITLSARKLLDKDIIFSQIEEKKRPISLETRPFQMDCTKAKNILMWQPKFLFSEAIEKTLNSYLSHVRRTGL